MHRLAADTRESAKVPDRYGRLFFKHVLTKVRLGDDLFDDEVAVTDPHGTSRRARVQRGLAERARAVEQIHGLPSSG
jgi:hypothetical protein